MHDLLGGQVHELRTRYGVHRWRQWPAFYRAIGLRWRWRDLPDFPAFLFQTTVFLQPGRSDHETAHSAWHEAGHYLWHRGNRCWWMEGGPEIDGIVGLFEDEAEYFADEFPVWDATGTLG